MLFLSTITSFLLLWAQHLFCHATGSEVTRMLQTPVEEECSDLTTDRRRRFCSSWKWVFNKRVTHLNRKYFYNIHFHAHYLGSEMKPVEEKCSDLSIDRRSKGFIQVEMSIKLHSVTNLKCFCNVYLLAHYLGSEIKAVGWSEKPFIKHRTTTFHINPAQQTLSQTSWLQSHCPQRL